MKKFHSTKKEKKKSNLILKAIRLLDYYYVSYRTISTKIKKPNLENSFKKSLGEKLLFFAVIMLHVRKNRFSAQKKTQKKNPREIVFDSFEENNIDMTNKSSHNKSF